MFEILVIIKDEVVCEEYRDVVNFIFYGGVVFDLVCLKRDTFNRYSEMYLGVIIFVGYLRFFSWGNGIVI